MLAVPLEWEGPRMGGNLSISIAQHLMEVYPLQSALQIPPFAS